MKEELDAVVKRFRTRLVAQRREKQLSQESLAGLAGMSLQHYQNIESGKTARPSLQTVCALCLALELELSELVVLRVEKRSRGRPRKEKGDPPAVEGPPSIG